MCTFKKLISFNQDLSNKLLIADKFCYLTQLLAAIAVIFNEHLIGKFSNKPVILGFYPMITS